jgi:regulation of enolase protein 1 (concanavalin A-like superfamily)
MGSVLACAALILADVAAGPEDVDVVFEETFPKGELSAGWTWIRENPEAWRVRDGALEILIEQGNMWGGANDAKNVLVRPLPDAEGRPLVIACTMENDPTNQYEQIDLVWYYADSHMVKIGIEQVDGERTIVMGREEKDKTRTIKIVPLASTKVDVWFRVVGDTITGSYRLPGEDAWREVGSCEVPRKGKPHMSIQAYQGDPNAPHWARVSNLGILAEK